MGMFAERMIELLRPLRLYDFKQGNINTSELLAYGGEMDRLEGELTAAEEELYLWSAGEKGLGRWAGCFVVPPASDNVNDLRSAVLALLAVGDESFTLKAVSDALTGCGMPCMCVEGDEPGVVVVSFPAIYGVPARFEVMRRIIESIIPCHLEIEYVYIQRAWEDAREELVWGNLTERCRIWDDLINLKDC